MRPRILLALWLLSDLLLFVAAYALAYGLRVGWILSSDYPLSQHLAMAAIVAPLWLLVLATTRTFHLARDQASLRNAAYITYAGLVGIALFTLTYYFQYKELFSRKLLLYAAVLQVGLTWAWHIGFDALSRRILRANPPAFPTLIVGLTREAKALMHTLERKKSPLKPVAILDAAGTSEKAVGSVPVVGKLNRLEDTLEKYRVTHLVQCSDLEQSINLLSACRRRGITYMLLPSVLGIVERDSRIESLEGAPVAVVSPRRGLLHWFFR